MIDATIEFIREHVAKATRPVFMCSFGKDSMALAQLIRRAFPNGLNGQHMPQAHVYPVEILYHRDPWFPHKHEFADSIIRSWSMTAHDLLPIHAGVKVNDESLELVARYNFGTAAMDVPKNTLPPEAYPRRDYICGLNDWLLRPKSIALPYPWDVVISGHKSCDVDPFEGGVPLKSSVTELGGVKLIFPLRDWSDSDVWNFIESERIPVQQTRYYDRYELQDKWHNNDYMHACTRCIDPRVVMPQVFCPKLQRLVPNVGGRVLQLKAEPDYVVKPPMDDEPLKRKIRELNIEKVA